MVLEPGKFKYGAVSVKSIILLWWRAWPMRQSWSHSLSLFRYCLMGALPRPHLILIVDCTESKSINTGTLERYTEATADSRGI